MLGKLLSSAAALMLSGLGASLVPNHYFKAEPREAEIRDAVPARPSLSPRLFGRRSKPRGPRKLKASSAARAANVLGVQHYAGKEFISYAEHDLRTRDRLFAEEFFGSEKALKG